MYLPETAIGYLEGNRLGLLLQGSYLNVLQRLSRVAIKSSSQPLQAAPAASPVFLGWPPQSHAANAQSWLLKDMHFGTCLPQENSPFEVICAEHVRLLCGEAFQVRPELKERHLREGSLLLRSTAHNIKTLSLTNHIMYIDDEFPESFP